MLASNLFCRQRAFRCFLLVCGNPKLAKRFRIRRENNAEMEGKSVPDCPGPPCCACSLLHGSIERRRGLGFAEIPSQRPKTPPTSMPTLLYIQVFQNVLGLSVRSSTEIEAPGRAPAAFDNPSKPILRFLPQIGEWMFMVLVAVKLEKAETWHG